MGILGRGKPGADTVTEAEVLDGSLVEADLDATEVDNIQAHAHSVLTGVGADDHHAKAHAHDGVDGSGTVGHGDLTGIGTDDHHVPPPEATQAEVDGGTVTGEYVSPDTLRDSIKVLANVGGDALTGNQDDWSPTGIATAQIVIADPNGADRIITGIVAQETGRVIVLVNTGTGGNKFTIKDEDAGSVAANRFALPADLDVLNFESVMLWYDGSRWRSIAKNTA